MFSIVQMKVPSEKLEDMAERRSGMMDCLHRAIGVGMYEHKGFYFSAPMATTSAQYFIVENALRSMFGDPPHLFEDVTSNYKLLRTRAPQAYDYGYVIEIGTMPGEFGTERLVAIPKENVEYQSGRYSSGMYTPIECVVYAKPVPMGPEHPAILDAILNA